MRDLQYTTVLMGRALTHAELENCISIIQKGDAVNLESARDELPKATVVTLAHLNDQIVGVGAIKRMRTEYAAKISKRAGFAFSAESMELGYVAVDPAHRGNRLSYALVASLIAGRNETMFATTSSERMMKALTRGEFVRQGDEWEGNSARLTLWLRPARLPTR